MHRALGIIRRPGVRRVLGRSIRASSVGFGVAGGAARGSTLSHRQTRNQGFRWTSGWNWQCPLPSQFVLTFRLREPLTPAGCSARSRRRWGSKRLAGDLPVGVEQLARPFRPGSCRTRQDIVLRLAPSALPGSLSPDAYVIRTSFPAQCQAARNASIWLSDSDTFFIAEHLRQIPISRPNIHCRGL